jgi:ribonuclease P protein component
MATRRRISSTHFAAVIPKDGEGYAVVVPKKIARLSVTRHSIKRKILSALRTLNLPPALIVFSRSSLHGVHYSEIEKELSNLISNIKT